MIDNIKEFLFSDKGIQVAISVYNGIKSKQHIHSNTTEEVTNIMCPTIGGTRERLNFVLSNCNEVKYQYIREEDRSKLPTISEEVLDGVLHRIRTLLPDYVRISEKDRDEWYRIVYNTRKQK